MYKKDRRADTTRLAYDGISDDLRGLSHDIGGSCVSGIYKDGIVNVVAASGSVKDILYLVSEILEETARLSGRDAKKFATDLLCYFNAKEDG